MPPLRKLQQRDAGQAQHLCQREAPCHCIAIGEAVTAQCQQHRRDHGHGRLPGNRADQSKRGHTACDRKHAGGQQPVAGEPAPQCDQPEIQWWMHVARPQALCDCRKTGPAILQCLHVGSRDYSAGQTGRTVPPVRNKVYCSSYSAPRSHAAAVNTATASSITATIFPARMRLHRALKQRRVWQHDAKDWLLRPFRADAAGRTCQCGPPATLRRGVNITNWFRFPPSRDPAALRAYLDDATISRLRQAGFTFVRLAVQSDVLSETEPLMDAVARLEHHGFAVVVAMSPWLAARNGAGSGCWRHGARSLRCCGASIRPEHSRKSLNEPVFADAPADWATLQHEVLRSDPRRPCH